MRGAHTRNSFWNSDLIANENHWTFTLFWGFMRNERFDERFSHCKWQVLPTTVHTLEYLYLRTWVDWLDGLTFRTWRSCAILRNCWKTERTPKDCTGSGLRNQTVMRSVFSGIVYHIFWSMKHVVTFWKKTLLLFWLHPLGFFNLCSCFIFNYVLQN